MTIKGIKRRWIFNSLVFTIVIFAILVTAFALVIRGYFYSGIKQTLKGRTNELYKSYSVQTETNFSDIAKEYVKNFTDSDTMELMIFDENNDTIITSTGFLPDCPEIRPDYDQARNSQNGFGIWEGKSFSGEKLIAVTRCIYDRSNRSG